MKGPAYVALWIDRLEAATVSWTNQELGAYMRLLMHQAREGSVPSGIERLARIAREDPTTFERLWDAVIGEKFGEDAEEPGVLRNARMARERDLALRKAGAARANGRKGGRPRKPSGLPSGIPTGVPSGPPSGDPTGVPSAKATQTQTQRDAAAGVDLSSRSEERESQGLAETPGAPPGPGPESSPHWPAARELFWAVLRPAGVHERAAPELCAALAGPRWLGGHPEAAVRAALERRVERARQAGDRPGAYLRRAVEDGGVDEDQGEEPAPARAGRGRIDPSPRRTPEEQAGELERMAADLEAAAERWEDEGREDRARELRERAARTRRALDRDRKLFACLEGGAPAAREGVA